MFIVDSERTYLREARPEDAEFVHRLVNSEGWLSNIGDRKIQNLADADAYIRNNYIAAYLKFGFGFWIVCTKIDDVPIGISGFAKRGHLDGVDLGYALLPEYFGKGYAIEATKAVLDYGLRTLGLNRIIAIVLHGNPRSIAILEKLGFSYEKDIIHDGNETLAQYHYLIQ